MVFSLSISIGVILMLSVRSLSTPLRFAGNAIDQVPFSEAATVPSPRFVTYSDAWTGSSSPPSPSAIKGYNTFNLAFLLLAGAWDNAQAWTTLSNGERSAIKSQYASAGIKLLVSALGSTDTPTTSGVDPVATADRFAHWVQLYQLDGIDVDYEDFGAFEKGDGSAENWLISFTNRLRTHLPVGKFIITHAPVAPWFQPNRWGGGGYLKVHSTVGHLIDWYNIQFYNQGATEYTTCSNLFTSSSSVWPNTAVFQMAANGVDLSKIVVGKPATSGDAGSGFMNTSTLASCLSQGKNKGWNGGAMVWQYPKADSHWISAVRTRSWPVN